MTYISSEMTPEEVERRKAQLLLLLAEEELLLDKAKAWEIKQDNPPIRGFL